MRSAPLSYQQWLRLPKRRLNVRGHTSAYVRQTELPGGLTAVVIVMVSAQIPGGITSGLSDFTAWRGFEWGNSTIASVRRESRLQAYFDMRCADNSRVSANSFGRASSSEPIVSLQRFKNPKRDRTETNSTTSLSLKWRRSAYWRLTQVPFSSSVRTQTSSVAQKMYIVRRCGVKEVTPTTLGCGV